MTVSIQGILTSTTEPSVEEDDSDTAPGNTRNTENNQEIDWPDAVPMQILGISSTTQDPQPEAYQSEHKGHYTPTNFEILELEEDSEQDQFTDAEYLNQHNTHCESERIRREYPARLQHLSDNEYYAQIDNSIGIECQIPKPSYYRTHTRATDNTPQMNQANSNPHNIPQMN